MHKTSAWPLSQAYAALIIYASLYPFSGWRDQGIAPWEFLWSPLPKYWTGFDRTNPIEGAARNSHYGASKGAVTSFVRALAVELARHRIRVNSILPGWIESDMTAAAMGDQKFAGAVLPRIPLRRWGTKEDFAGIAVYLMSNASRYHTGDSFVIDGAYTIF